MVTFRLVKWQPFAIMDILKFKILTAAMLQRGNLQQHTNFMVIC